jgi:hypothetical protein
MLKSNVEIRQKAILDEKVGEDIGYDLGVSMVKAFFDKYGEGNAQFVGKDILTKLLDQPGCIGISIYNALNEKGERTFVLVGLDRENNPILETSIITPDGKLDSKQGIVADRMRVENGWFSV